MKRNPKDGSLSTGSHILQTSNMRRRPRNSSRSLTISPDHCETPDSSNQVESGKEPPSTDASGVEDNIELNDFKKENATITCSNKSCKSSGLFQSVSTLACSIYVFLDNWEFLIVPLLLTACAFFTRMWRIGISNIVTWDEAHFGKFASHYLKREFYFDVHPPLGKLLVGLSGYLAGYNGTFDFKSGTAYPEELNYTFMRRFNSAFGALCVPLAYWTAKELRLRRRSSLLVALMILFDNSYTTISRFILLDSMLLFFTFTTIMCWVKFHQLQFKPFSMEWFLWLCLTGVSIGCVCSIKWVGLFCTALVGMYTIEDLWQRFGDLRIPKSRLTFHLACRVFGLIFIPFLVYLFSFWLHFQVLSSSGPGDAQMSSLFQANLRGSNIGKDSPLEVALGSRITVKNMGYGGGLLHSHVQTYPEGSHQQQVTCYHHKDANNEWFVYSNRNEKEFIPDEEAIRYIGHGSVIRLIHAQTGRNLHSHAISAPITKSNWEVSCYGNLTVGDTKDHWKVEIIDDISSRDYSRLRTLTTTFRLRHVDMGCYLHAGTVNLPQWGFKQIEVSCVKANKARDKYTQWNIESHYNDKMPPGNPKVYRSSFWRDFIHLNVAMMTSNNALVPDPDKHDEIASKFWQWPLLTVGLRMCSWDEKTIKYFLIGNIFVYWLSTATLVLFVGLIAWYAVRWQRGYKPLLKRQFEHIRIAGIYPIIGWVLHYMPFIVMARVTYLHHYFPALYFSVLVAGFFIDWLGLWLDNTDINYELIPETVDDNSDKLPSTSIKTHSIPMHGKQWSWALYILLYVGVISTFIAFRAMTFGMQGPATKWAYLNFLPTWRISDK